MKNTILLFTCLAFCPAFANAADTSALTSLRLPVGARAVAMGEAMSAAAADATALYWNPALLAQANGNSVALMHAAYLAGTSYDFGAVNFRKNKFGLAIGVQKFASGDMTGYDDTGTEVGTFSHSDLAIMLGLGYEFLPGYAAGVTPKYVHSSLVSDAETWAVDIGFATPYYNDRVKFAAVLANWGGKIHYDRADEDLPRILRLGAACKVTPKLVATAEAGLPKAGTKYVAGGLEYNEVIDKVRLAGRAGYNSRTAGDVPGFNGLSAGVGIGFGQVTADYALTFFGELGTAHRFSLSFKFDN